MFNYVVYLSEKQFKYVSSAINNDINETTFSCLKNPANPGPLGHKHCTLKCRALYTDLACTAQQLLLDMAALPKAVLSTPFSPNVLYIYIYYYYYYYA